MTTHISKTISFVVQSSLMGLGIALLVLLFGSDYRANLFNNAEANSYAHAVRRAAPSVVSIHTASAVAVSINPLLEDPLFKNFFEFLLPRTSRA